MSSSGATYPDWRDSSWPWMAKLDRAKHHIDDLRTELTDFHQSAYSVIYEPGDKPEATVIRLHISKPVPVQFSTMIGDAIHNMRSSLDALAYELARRRVGGVLTPDQERRTAFPFFRHRAKLDKFFDERADIYGPAEKEALDSVAPGWMWDGMGSEQAAAIIGPREDDVTGDMLWQLNRLVEHRQAPSAAFHRLVAGRHLLGLRARPDARLDPWTPALARRCGHRHDCVSGGRRTHTG